MGALTGAFIGALTGAFIGAFTGAFTDVRSRIVRSCTVMSGIYTTPRGRDFLRSFSMSSNSLT
ncbi:hypothetical protein [Methanosarcina sp. KYL-1]|uniref:hypothetical protein n=1 Tax=Methanosarcina sp. KYL-1 TaxID=2602068 RepID=UPI00350E5598